MNDQQQSRADALTEEQIRAFAEGACEYEIGRGVFRQNVATVGNVILAIRNAVNLAAASLVEQPAAAQADGACKRCGSTTAQACNDVGCFYLESGDGEPSAAPADERAALPQIPDLVKATAWLTMCLRTELSRLDDTTHKALDEVEAQLSCVRAITNGAIDYEAMVAARAAASPAAEEVAFEVTEEIAADWAKRHDIEHVLKHHSTQRNAIEDARTLHLLDAPQPAQGDAPAEAREPIAWVTDDDRAITAAQKQRALADGGATASSVRPYSVPCYAVSAPADAGEAAPFGWAQPKGGNYFTRNELSAKRIGGLVPVYTAPPAARVASLTDEQRESIEHAATWLGRSEDLQNKAHAKRLRALLNGADR
ncbi:putative gp43 [Burkholderia pseudomallei]|uniref:hypothetical protein n=1 Tax=Burkholderia pseudomallei TaxID=28450 RepID=UPI00050E0777|nr:hypothetical protein [Burkholderia pseudomallei]KGD52057.1 putative gp43 [Burkholderia pseudomallei]